MRILILADNDNYTWTGPIQPVDLVVSCGDVYAPLIIAAAKACSATQIVAVKGNHDLPSTFPPLITDLHLRVVTLANGLHLGGFNGSWRYKPKGNFLYSQEEAAALIGQLPPVDILVAHNSPAGVHERDADVHQGFAALNDYIGRHSPRLLIHGHQHVNSETQVGGTRVMCVFGSMVMEVESPDGTLVHHRGYREDQNENGDGG
jgi:Icc-related predicted phosphoesterase